MSAFQTPDGPTAEELTDACGTDSSWACERVLELTDSRAWAQATDLLDRPTKILMILVIAVVASWLLRRAIRRFTDRIGDAEAQDRLRRRLRRQAYDPARAVSASSLRAAARANTLAQVLRSIASITIWTIAVVMMLGELGINLGPLIAGAGIAGVALGFGAQSLVKDFLSGMFMLIEDQYGVGDIIDVGEASGTVEEVTLRTTRLRDVDGTVWYIPNGRIERVGNQSQQWARALLDVSVAYGTDIDEAQEVIKATADTLWQDPEWESQIIGEPEVWGIEQLAADAIVIRLVVRTQPSAQWGVMRELRRRLADSFYSNGIEIPFPQRSVWVRQGPVLPEEFDGLSPDAGDDGADPGAEELEHAPVHEVPQPRRPRPTRPKGEDPGIDMGG